MKTTAKIVMGAAAGVVGVGSLLGVALAQAEPSDTSSPSTSASAGTDDQGFGPRGGHHGEGGTMHDAFASELASKLGLDQATVAAAIEAARDATRPSEPPADGTRPTEEEMTAMHDAFVAELASQLGIDQATLTQALDELQADRQAARQADFQARLDQAVADGKLTQTEADAVAKAYEAGVLGPMGGRGGGMGPMGGGPR